MGRTIALTAALAGALLLAWLGTKTPGSEPVGVPPITTAFQTDLAMVDIRRIAREPHPIGSAANASVRDYLLGRMGALGLSPATQTGLAVETRAYGGETWVVGGSVVNIVGVLPGRDRTKPALALMAHYDSVPASPGAADDATGVAVVLDVIRALKAKGAPERDIIVILTDGEEAGLLGARVFFTEHPLRKRIGLLINLESRGGGGRANMFQTGPGNGALIPVFAQSAVSPISNALAVFLYERMPNDTDFTVSKEVGIRGLNFAFIGRQFDYHSLTSTPANLDQGSVRHMGEQTLAAAASLAFAETLPGKAPDAVYSQTFGDHILAYPVWGGWIAWLIAAGLIALAWARGRRSDEFRLPDAARGAGAAVFLLLAGALLMHLARRATGVGFGFMEQRPLLAQWALWETSLAVLGLGLLLLVPVLLSRERMRLWLAGAGLCGALLCLAFTGGDLVGVGLGLATAGVGYAAFGKPAAMPGAWLGVLLTGLVAGLALQIFLPAVAFLVIWPLVLAGLGAAASLMGTRMDLSRTVGLVLLAALGGGWLAVFFHVVSQGLDLPDLLALFLWLGAFLVWPLAWPAKPPRLALAPAVALLALGVVLVGVVRFNDPWTARHPQATSVFHVLDDRTGKAMLVATPAKLDPWSRAALSAAGGPISKQDIRPLVRRPVWAAPAGTGPIGQLPASITSRDGAVTLALPVLTSPTAQVVTLDFKADVPMTLVQVDARPVMVKVAAGQWVHVRTTALKLSWVRFVPAGPGSVDARYAVIDSAWPAGAKPLPPRPSSVMPFDRSDSSVVISSARYAW